MNFLYDVSKASIQNNHWSTKVRLLGKLEKSREHTLLWIEPIVNKSKQLSHHELLISKQFGTINQSTPCSHPIYIPYSNCLPSIHWQSFQILFQSCRRMLVPLVVNLPHASTVLSQRLARRRDLAPMRCLSSIAFWRRRMLAPRRVNWTNLQKLWNQWNFVRTEKKCVEESFYFLFFCALVQWTSKLINNLYTQVNKVTEGEKKCQSQWRKTSSHRLEVQTRYSGAFSAAALSKTTTRTSNEKKIINDECCQRPRLNVLLYIDQTRQNGRRNLALFLWNEFPVARVVPQHRET